MRILGVAVAGIMLTGSLAACSNDSEGSGPDLDQDTAAYVEMGAWADPDTVHIGEHDVPLPGVQRLSYTSLGVLTFSVNEDNKGVLNLVRANGDVEPLEFRGLDPMQMPASDVDSPNVAWVRVGEKPGTSEMVVGDLETGKETVIGEPWQGEPIPMVSLWDDWVVTANDPDHQVNWHTGESAPLPVDGVQPPVFVSNYVHGRYFGSSTDDAGTVAVHSQTDSALIGSAAGGEIGDYVNLSPDGRYLLVVDGDTAVVTDVDSDDEATLPDGSGETGDSGPGWTPDGHILWRDGSTLQLCDPATGKCEKTDELDDVPLTFVRGSSTQLRG